MEICFSCQLTCKPSLTLMNDGMMTIREHPLLWGAGFRTKYSTCKYKRRIWSNHQKTSKKHVTQSIPTNVQQMNFTILLISQGVKGEHHGGSWRSTKGDGRSAKGPPTVLKEPRIPMGFPGALRCPKRYPEDSWMKVVKDNICMCHIINLTSLTWNLKTKHWKKKKPFK